jgi:hypothetical protein
MEQPLDEGVKMSKFKIGDRVVVVSDCAFTAKENGISYGDVFEVSVHLGPHDGSWNFDLYAPTKWEVAYSDDELVLESIYNSPLYKALS